LPFNLDQASAAGADRLHISVFTEVGQVDPGREYGVQHARARVDGDDATVYFNCHARRGYHGQSPIVTLMRLAPPRPWTM